MGFDTHFLRNNGLQAAGNCCRTLSGHPFEKLGLIRKQVERALEGVPATGDPPWLVDTLTLVLQELSDRRGRELTNDEVNTFVQAATAIVAP